MQVTDISDRLPRHPDWGHPDPAQRRRFRTRDLAGLQAHVVHHTVGSPSQTPEAVANYHVNTRGWAGIGYTYWIAANGDILQTNPLELFGAGVKWHNDIYLSTALPGDFRSGREPTQQQLDSLAWLHNSYIPVALGRHLPILGHKECLEAVTACPGSWNWHAIEQQPEQPLYVIRVYPDRVEVE